MKKYYVFFNKSNRRYEVRKATIIGETEDSYVILEGEDTIVKRKDCVFDDKNYANTVKKELVTTRTVKNRFKGKYYICPKCGKKIRRNEITVDHKIPKAFFKKLAKERYGVDDLRLAEELWEQCWNFNNLRLICEDCNKKKSSNPYILERYIAKKSYMQKKNECVNRGARKMNIRNNNFISKDLEMEILRRYGNTFDKKYIL